MKSLFLNLLYALLIIDWKLCESARKQGKKLSIESLHKLALDDPNDIGQWQFVNPNEWNERYEGCRGAKQSPINIVTSKSVFNERLGDFIFRNYDVPFRWNVTFDGFSVGFTPIYTDDRRIRIRGSNFGKARFDLLNFHFHWGNALNGSEHYINGKHEPAEVHLVHRGELNGETRFTVLGFLFKLSTERNSDLSVVLRELKKMQDDNGEFKVNQPIVSEPFPLTRLIPNLDQMNRRGYYRYDGSLTVPPCTEGIIWNVFRTKLPISLKQARIFNGNDSFRPVQPLNGRVIHRSFTNSKRSRYN